MTTINEKKEYELMMYVCRSNIFNIFNQNKINNIDINTQDEYGNTLLIYAVLNKDINMIKLLLSYHLKTEYVDKLINNTHYVKVITNNNENIDVNIKNKKGKTALMLANNDPEIIRLLLQVENIDINYITKKENNVYFTPKNIIICLLLLYSIHNKL